MVTYSGQKLTEEDQMTISNIKKLLVSQINPKKSHKEIHFIFVNVYHFINLCNLAIRYVFDKLVPKLTKYTSYKALNLSKAVPNNLVFGDNLL